MSDGTAVELRTDRPHSARIYDYLLDGKDNYGIDQLAAKEIVRCWPGAGRSAQTSRVFMRKAIGHLAEQGITQFLDIGVGIPMSPNLHEVAQEIHPEARVVYVDNDPIVLAHARALMVSAPQGQVTCLHADAGSPATILDSPQLTQTLDLTRPVAVSMVALLHHLTDDRVARETVAALTAALAAGSYLVVSHATSDFDPPTISAVTRVYNDDAGIPFAPRSREQLARLLSGVDVLDPGIVPAHRWHADGIDPPASWDAEMSLYAALARK
ncbi:SAM-dependent methyltransferase [Nocardia takedensis]|uniref:SAM-dependent methyltransferase n=1 Tax=Nocardia takedensis TaxID=259390 RepID=UPI003F761BA1